jgi:hypothetical protein
MAKIILGQRPKTFSHTVSFPQLDGTPGTISLTYKYRTRSEFAAFADELRAEIATAQAAELEALKAIVAKGGAVADMTQAEMLDRETKTNVSYIIRCVEGWNLDVPFDEAAVRQLADEVPGAIPEIISAYRDAITTGRLGN